MSRGRSSACRSMKKVLILNHNQEQHGTYYRCLFLGKGLAQRGYQVSMICASGRDFDLMIRRQHVTDNFKIYTLPRVKYHKYFTGQLLRMFITAVWALFARFDVCLAFTVAQAQIAVPAWVAKVLRKKPLVIDWDDMWGGGFAEEHSALVSSVLSFCERYFLIYADKITFVSEAIREEIDIAAKQYPRIASIPKIKIPNGANTAQIIMREKDASRRELGIADTIVLLSVGNTYTDSLGLMLTAFDAVRTKRPEAVLYLVGGVEMPDRFLRIFEKNREAIRLTGKMPFSAVPAYMGAADVLLLPYTHVFQSGVLFLGYSFGLPVIAADVGSLREEILEGKTGFVFPAGDSAGMTKAIEKYFSSDLYKNLDDRRQEIQAYANERYSWRKVGSMTRAVYSELLLTRN